MYKKKKTWTTYTLSGVNHPKPPFFFSFLLHGESFTDFHIYLNSLSPYLSLSHSFCLPPSPPPHGSSPPLHHYHLAALFPWFISLFVSSLSLSLFLCHYSLHRALSLGVYSSCLFLSCSWELCCSFPKPTHNPFGEFSPCYIYLSCLFCCFGSY